VVSLVGYETLSDRAEAVVDSLIAFEQEAVDLEADLRRKAQKGSQAGVGSAEGGPVGHVADGVWEGCSAVIWGRERGEGVVRACWLRFFG
jgi:hypothetical protein